MKSAILVLEDGTQFYGQSIGVTGTSVGEVIFNTSMTGYQEILTDPSYSHQIVTFTYPHIGNVGINEDDNESSCIHVRGLVIHNLTLITSNFRCTSSLEDYLIAHNIIAISDVDTRKLTRLLRKKGAQNGCIIAGPNPNAMLALHEARDFPGLRGMDLVKIVTTKEQYTWVQGSINIFSNISHILINENLSYHVVIYDFGIKRNIMRLLVDRGCRLTVVPAKTSPKDILNMDPDGIFLANGPGDPSSCDYAITSIQYLLYASIPLFGICLGHQLLALASGAKIVKMKFGHHGSNHPVKDMKSNQVIITSQNHGFVVDQINLPIQLQTTHISLFDGTLEGIHHISKPAFSLQWHPEGSPGPHDSQVFFDRFIDLMKIYRNQ